MAVNVIAYTLILLLVACVIVGWLSGNLDKCKAKLDVLHEDIDTKTSECAASKDYLKKQLQSTTTELRQFNALKQENKNLNERLSQMENALKEARDKNKRIENSKKALEDEVERLREINQNNAETSGRQAALEKDIRVLKKQNRECGFCNERLKTVLQNERICGDKVIDLEAAVTAGDSRRKSEEKRTFELELQVINLKTSLKLTQDKTASGQKDKDTYMTSLSECLMNSTRLSQRLDDVTRDYAEVTSDGYCLTADPSHIFGTVTTVCTVLSLCTLVIIISLRRCYYAVWRGYGRIANSTQWLIAKFYDRQSPYYGHDRPRFYDNDQFSRNSKSKSIF